MKNIFIIICLLSYFAYAVEKKDRVEIEVKNFGSAKILVSCPKKYQSSFSLDSIFYYYDYKTMKDLCGKLGFERGETSVDYIIGMSYMNMKVNLSYENIKNNQKIKLSFMKSYYFDNPYGPFEADVILENFIKVQSITVSYDVFLVNPNNKKSLVFTDKKTIFGDEDDYIDIKKIIPKIKTYTNTYNINQEVECIDNKIWVKKYGQTSGNNCEWKEIKP